MPCRFASSGTVAISRRASRAILALNAASNFLRDLVISVLHRLRQSRTLHTLTFGPISGVHFTGIAPTRHRQIGFWGLANSACFQSAETSNANGCRFQSLLRGPGPLAYFSRAIQG